MYFLFLFVIAYLPFIVLLPSSVAGSTVEGVSDEVLAPLFVELSLKFSDYDAATGGISLEHDYRVDEIDAVMRGAIDFSIISMDVAPHQYTVVPDLQMIPLTIIPIVLSYNVPEVEDELTLSLPVVGDIYSGSIRFWNDSRIKALNPNLPLPAKPITPFIVQGDSAATHLFTDILSGHSTQWADTFGIFSDSTGFLNSSVTLTQCTNVSAMAEKITSTPYSIGYMSLNQAISHSMAYAALLNMHHQPTMPIASFVESDLTTDLLDDKLMLNLLNLPGRFTYPAWGAGYALIRLNSMVHCNDGMALAKFLAWVLTNETAEETMFDLGFMEVPIGIHSPAMMKLLSMTCGGKTVFTETVLPFGGPSQIDGLMMPWTEGFMGVTHNTRLVFTKAESTDILAKLKSKQVILGLSSTDLSENDYASMPGIIQIPAIVTAVSLVFNLPEKRPELPFVVERNTLVELYNGMITEWSHPELRKLNPFIAAPHEPITIVAINKSSSIYFMLKSALASFDSTSSNKTSFDISPKSDGAATSMAIEDGFVPVFQVPNPRVEQILRSMTCNGQLLWPYPPEVKFNWVPIVVPCAIGILILAALLGVAFWKFRARMKYLTAKLNDARIAVELSNAIATLDLDKMAFLETIERPTTTQNSCLKILRTLRHVKKYVPGTVICQLIKEVNGDDDDDDDEEELIVDEVGLEKKKLDDQSDCHNAAASEHTFNDTASKTSKGTFSEAGSLSTGGAENRRASKLSIRSAFSSERGGGGGKVAAIVTSTSRTRVGKAKASKMTAKGKYKATATTAASVSESQASSLGLLPAEDGTVIRIVRRDMTVMFMGLSNFESLLKSDTNTTVLMFNKFFEAVFKIVHSTAGMIVSLDGRHILMHWNAAKKCSTARLQACEVAGKIISAAKETLFQVKIGIAHGNAHYTSLGCDLMSSLLVLGSIWNRARVLHDLNDIYRTNILVDDEVRKQGPNGALFLLDIIDIEDEQYGMKKCRISELVVEAIQSATDMDGEWLYAFQSSTTESSIAGRQLAWAKCIDAFFKGQYAPAHDYITAYILKYGADLPPIFCQEIKAILDDLMVNNDNAVNSNGPTASSSRHTGGGLEYIHVVSPIPSIRFGRREPSAIRSNLSDTRSVPSSIDCMEIQ